MSYQWKRLEAEFVGKRFGDLVVQTRAGCRGAHSAWNCLCDCGKEKVVAAPNLKRGFTLSCGCRKNRMTGKSAVVRPGDRFGRLVALEFVGYRNRHSYFSFRCDCGNEKVISANAVKRGDAKSCGCFRDEHVLKIAALSPGRDGKAPLRMLFKDYQTRCRARRIDFSISIGEFETLILAHCAYCGAPPVQSDRKKYGDYAANGIDRINSAVGYVGGNVATACRVCNTAKSTMSVGEFERWVVRVHAHLNLEAKQ